jgi:hypothetical protein
MSAYFNEVNIVSGTLNIGSGTSPNYDIILSDTSGIPTVFNNLNKNLDFSVKGTSTDKILYFDASTGRLGLGTNLPDAPLHMVSSCASAGLKIENLTNCATGVRLLLIHKPQTPPETGSFPATIDLAGRDDNYADIIYGQIKARVLSSATSQTSGEILFTVDHTGVNKTVFRSSLVDTVLGGLNSATGNRYNVVGYNNSLSGLSYVNVGSNNTAIIATGIIIGNNTVASGEKILIVTNNSEVLGSRNISFATDSNISGISNVIIGYNILSTGSNNVLIGNNNSINGNSIVGLLNNATINGSSGIGFGSYNTVSGNHHIYMGNDIDISGQDDVAVGSKINISGSRNIVYGSDSDVSGQDIVSIGTDNNPLNVTSGIYIGNNINISGSQRSVIIGLGNTTTSGLNESVILGINNSTASGMPTGLVVIGQSNQVSVIKDSLIIGNRNNLSGVVLNNVVVGPRNATPTTSTNNTIFGTMNNVSGARIYSDGSILGQPIRIDGSMANTNIFGINNMASRASGSVVVGNRSRVSGIGINTVGSLNNLQGANYLQNIGNSNFVVGDNNTTIGNKIDLVGSDSIVVSTDPVYRSQVFGSGNIVLGSNEVIVSGLTIGQHNEIHGPLNIVYGNYNTVGSARYPFTMSTSTPTNVVIVGNINEYQGGDKVIVSIYAPGSTTPTSYIQNIVDGEEDGQSLGVIKQNVGSNFTTTLVLTAPIGLTNTIEYSTIDDFDDDFAASATVSGYVMLLQDASVDQDDTVTSPLYGFKNTILGYNNNNTHASGIILGSNNRVSGVKHIVIGHGISGYYNDAVQIGSNNINKMVLDDFKIVFNTGAFQNFVYFNSSNGGNGTNNIRAMKVDLSTNRVGLNNDNPRSTLDVSGTLTASSIRMGLSSSSGHVLTSNNSGVASWQLPVNLSGTNSGLLFKTSDKVGSGIREIAFNTTSKEMYYLRGDRESNGPLSLDNPTAIEERVVIFSPTGLFINNASNDYGYDFIVKGSGIRSEIEGDNSVYLIRTRISENAIQVYNMSGVSGFMERLHCSTQLRLPTSLTGTMLYSDNQGYLLSKSFAPYSLLYTNQNYVSTGSSSFRYYPNQQAITIGLTGTPPALADSSLVTGSSNTFNNIILGSNTGVNTIFNNAGLNNQFIIVDANQSISKHGFNYDTASGCLGVGVRNSDQSWAVSSTLTNQSWPAAGKLVVDGKIRARSLQLSDNSPNVLPGSTGINKYLKIVDVNGNVGLGNILDDFDFQFSGIHPLTVSLNQADDRVDLRFATTNKNGVALTSASNGLLVAYNGNSWEHAIGFRIYQPELSSSNVDVIPGIMAGGDLALNSCYNNHVFGGGSFVKGNSSFAGSSQYSRFYLRGSTGGSNTSELLSDWHKNVTTVPNGNNTISIQYLPQGAATSTDHNQSFVWNYTIDFSAIFSDDASLANRTYEGCAGKIEGSLISYILPNGSRYAGKMGSDTVTFRSSSSNVSYTTNVPPIFASIEQAGNNANIQRLAIVARGKENYNAMWSVTAHIQQVMMPSGVQFGGTTITPG